MFSRKFSPSNISRYTVISIAQFSILRLFFSNVILLKIMVVRPRLFMDSVRAYQPQSETGTCRSSSFLPLFKLFTSVHALPVSAKINSERSLQVEEEDDKTVPSVSCEVSRPDEVRSTGTPAHVNEDQDTASNEETQPSHAQATPRQIKVHVHVHVQCNGSYYIKATKFWVLQNYCVP